MNVDLVILTNTAGSVWQRSIGAYQVAHHARTRGLTCQVIDFTEYFTNQELEDLLKKFIGNSTLAIGVSTTFYENTEAKKSFISTSRRFDSVIPDSIRTVIEKIKLIYPKIKIIAGGANSYQIKDDNLFDAVFHGYSEESVVSYLTTLKSNTRRIWPMQGSTAVIDGATDHFDIETLEHRWHKNDCILPKETLPIEISRGCIFKCKFCSYPLNGKKKFDYLRDPQRIKDELIENYNLYGTTNYYFTDDTFNDSTFKLERLHEVITSLPFKINFVAYLRVDLLYAHPEQIPLLYEMGLRSAFFGIETLNHESGKVIGKGMDPEVIKKFIVELHDVHWRKEVAFTTSFIIGLPGETIDSVMAAHAWCQSAPVNDVWFPLFIKFNGHFKSEFDINFMKYGYSIDENNEWSNDNMTYQSALALAEKFNNGGLHQDNGPNAWFLFSLLSYGYTVSELKDIPISDLPRLTFARKKRSMISQYKELLNSVILDN